MRLLLVDDDPGLRALVAATFDDVMVDVVEADSAEAARAEIARVHPDVIVLDVVMPRESGLELCQDLKSRPETPSIPIVLLSGSIELASRTAADAGADAYLPKPFSPLQLLAVVERLAGRAEPIPLVVPPDDGHADPQLML